MDKRSLKIISIISGLLLILGLGLYSVEDGTTHFSSTLNSKGFELTNAENYSLQEIKRNEIAEIEVTEVSGKAGENRIQARIFSDVTSEFTENYIQNQKNELAAIYTDVPSPYEGIPGRQIDCPDKFVPELNTNYSEKAQFQLYSDGKNKIGACSNSTAQFRTQISMLYCSETNNFIRVRISKPVERNKFTEKIFCDRT